MYKYLLADEEDDEYECAAVLSKHEQDVKCVVWHPTDDVCVLSHCIYIYI